MAQSDWGTLSAGLTEDDVRRGPTAGVAAPNGGGTHVYGMRSVDATAGAVGRYALQSNFSPISANGGRITGAIRRGSLTAPNGFAPFFFFGADGSAITNQAYLLGLSDESECHIQLRKGTISNGLAAVQLIDPDVTPNVLMRSTNVFAPDIWHHLRLDVIVQGTGDVILQVLRNDLTLHSVVSPVWEAVPGMEGPFEAFDGFVDDALGVNTGSVPLLGGFCGFGARFEQANRAAYFDHISLDRQI